MSEPLFLAPATLDEALALLAESAGSPLALLAGGTDLFPKWAAGQPRPERVLSLHRLAAELRQIVREGSDLLRIGASCTHSDLARSEEVRRASPALAEAAATIGAVQVQNQGTLGGNLVNASPAADLPPPLVAAGALVELASIEGRRRVPLDRFFLGYRRIDRRPDELVIAVLVPSLPAGAREHFCKVGTRRAQAIAKVNGACRLTLSGEGTILSVGIALGSIAPTVIRLTNLERWLTGRAPDEKTAEAAEAMVREAVRPIDDVRSTAEYRRHVAGRLVRRWIQHDLEPCG